jgi:Uma2 family endonuclease
VLRFALSQPRMDLSVAKDPIVEEVRRIREAQFAKCGFDMQAFFAAARERQEKSGCKVVAPPPKRRRTASTAGITYEEFLVWHPDHGLAEWVDGEAFAMPLPTTDHQRLSGFLYCCVSYYVEGKALGQVLVAPVQMRLPRSGREPDVLFVATENRARIEEQYINGPADLAVEVVSPDSRKRDGVEKFREYEQAGVREYWILDGKKKEAAFYGLGADRAYHALPVDEHNVFHSEVLAGLWLRVDWLWQQPQPLLTSVLKEWGLI